MVEGSRRLSLGPSYGRTHIWAYDWGLLNSVDGPLPGTGDTVSFTYSSDGYLATRTDEVGHNRDVSALIRRLFLRSVRFFAVIARQTTLG